MVSQVCRSLFYFIHGFSIEQILQQEWFSDQIVWSLIFNIYSALSHI